MSVALLPRRILALSSGEEHEFMLRVRWDGDFHVTPWGKSRWPGPGTLVAIDPAYCLRRRMRLMPRSAAELDAIAADLFPFDLTDWHLALYQGPDSLEVCALDEKQYQALTAVASTAIIAPASADAIGDALRQRLRHGALFDFVPKTRFLIGPAPLFAAANATALIAVLGIIAGLFVMGQSSQTRALRAEILSLQDKAAQVTQRRQATAMMVRSVNELTVFAKQPGGTLAPDLGRLLAAVPEGTAVDKILWKGQKLVISGLGNDALTWLQPLGIPEQAVEINDNPKLDRFTVTLSLTAQ